MISRSPLIPGRRRHPRIGTTALETFASPLTHERVDEALAHVGAGGVKPPKQICSAIDDGADS